jgi:hypothetical protein
MYRSNHFTSGLRVVNFSAIELQFEHQLEFDSEDIPSIVKKLRKYADLPYVFVVSNEQTKRVSEILALLKGIRSPCYPYALFTLFDGAFKHDAMDVDVVQIGCVDAVTITNRIEEYAYAKFRFDKNNLRVGSSGHVPETVDVVIIGAGITGLYAANRLVQSGISFCILEKNEKVGGIWSMYANSTSRVNSSEGAYRLIEHRTRTNRDHSPAREILEDVVRLAQNVQDHLFLESEVEGIAKIENRYHVKYNHAGRASRIVSKGVILAINDRVGAPKKIEWENQAVFRGYIVEGISNHTEGLDYRGKRVVIVGMGAFAVENARTALEEGASHVTVVGRRHGTVCPKIIDYLNFASPYDEAFKHDKQSNFRNMVYWKKMYELSGATQPECWMAKVKHDGHTISVSDIWFVGHYLNKLETITGDISHMFEKGVVVDGQHHINADIVVNCIGFERNASLAKSLCGFDQMYNNNYVGRDFMYLADAFIDDDAFNSFFGSSVLEMAKFYIEVYIKYFDNHQFSDMMKTNGIEKIPIEERKWSHYIAGATALINSHPDLYQIAEKQVSHRTRNFLQKHDIETYIEENKREWIDIHTLLAGKPMKEEDCLPYVFEKLLHQKQPRMNPGHGRTCTQESATRRPLRVAPTCGSTAPQEIPKETS